MMPDLHVAWRMLSKFREFMSSCLLFVLCVGPSHSISMLTLFQGWAGSYQGLSQPTFLSLFCWGLFMAPQTCLCLSFLSFWMVYCLVPNRVDPMLVYELSGVRVCDLFFLWQLQGCGIFHVLPSSDQQGGRPAHSQGCPAFLVGTSCWGTGEGKGRGFRKCHRPPLSLILGRLEKCCSFFLCPFISFRVLKWLVVTFLLCQFSTARTLQIPFSAILEVSLTRCSTLKWKL